MQRKDTEVSIEQALTSALSGNTSAGLPISSRNALQVTAVLCGVRAIAEGVAQMPISVIRQERIGPSRSRMPVPYMGGAAVLDGGGLAILNRVGDEVRELLPVPMGSWSIEQLRDWSLRFRVDYADKTHGYFSHDQVMHLRGPSLNGFRGLSAVHAAREAIGLSASLERQQSRYSGRGGVPSGALSFAEPLSREAVSKLRELWQERYGPSGDGGIAILDGSAKFEQFTMTSVDAQHLETRKRQVEEIARALRIQPIMLMQSDKAATFASAEQMFRMHVVHTLNPWKRRLEDVAHLSILRRDPDLRIDLNERSLLRGDFRDVAEYYSAALGSGGSKGWMTQNEVRADMGLNRVSDDGADALPMGAMEQEGRRCLTT